MFNAPSVIAAALAVLQGVLAVLVLVSSVRALGAVRRARSAHERDVAEVGSLRPALHALALCVVAIASWPLLVGVLSSHVPQWDGVMCIAGVARIGTGTDGASRHLPRLLDVLLATKPMLLLLAGAWLTAHGVTRRAAGRPGALGPTLLAALGGVALCDAAIELAYLTIPKTEVFLASGCCFSAPSAVAGPASWVERSLPGTPPWAVLAVLGLSAALLAGGLVVAGRSPTGEPRRFWATLVVLGAALGVAAQHVVVALASPALLGAPAHRCGWCVIERSALGGLAVAALLSFLTALVLGAFAAALERSRGATDAAVSRGLARLALASLVAAAAVSAAAALF